MVTVTLGFVQQLLTHRLFPKKSQSILDAAVLTVLHEGNAKRHALESVLFFGLVEVMRQRRPSPVIAVRQWAVVSSPEARQDRTLAEPYLRGHWAYIVVLGVRSCFDGAGPHL
jgi:hypothetical protein